MERSGLTGLYQTVVLLTVRPRRVIFLLSVAHSRYTGHCKLHGPVVSDILFKGCRTLNNSASVQAFRSERLEE